VGTVTHMRRVSGGPTAPTQDPSLLVLVSSRSLLVSSSRSLLVSSRSLLVLGVRSVYVLVVTHRVRIISASFTSRCIITHRLRIVRGSTRHHTVQHFLRAARLHAPDALDPDLQARLHDLKKLQARRPSGTPRPIATQGRRHRGPDRGQGSRIRF
jgi:hypothetical protein